LNILLLISSLNFGGAEKQAVVDANLLSHKNKVYLGAFNDGPLNSQVSDDVKVLLIKKRNYIVTAFHLARFTKENNIQVIHASLFAPMNISALSTVFNKVNVIWNFHSHEYNIPFRSRLSFKILSRLKSVKKIIFVSNELRDFFRKSGFNFPDGKVDVVYNSGSFNGTATIRKAESRKIIIGYVGRLVRLKRLDYLIELSSYLLSRKYENFEIRIIGDGDTKEELEKFTNEGGLRDYIKFFGFISDTESFYSEFDIFVNPSGEECLSIALIDAGIAGIASVVFDVGGNKEIVLNERSGFVVKSKEEFFEKVLALCKDSIKRDSFGKEAREYCGEGFSKNIRFTNLENLIRECESMR